MILYIDTSAAAKLRLYREAGLLSGSHLRSLDALHLAVALRVTAEIMVTYDRRQVDAARSVGLPVLAP